MLKQKDMLNYHVKLEDDFRYAKLKQTEFLNIYSDYTTSMHDLYRTAKSKAVTKNEHDEINQYTKLNLRYLDKLNEKSRKQRSLIQTINKYKRDGLKTQFEQIKNEVNELNNSPINYPIFDKFKRGVMRKPKTETNLLLKSIETITAGLHNELSENQNIINDLVETIVLFEESNQYDGIDYEREYQYEERMISLYDDFIQDKRNRVSMGKGKLTKDDIAFINEDISYYENKKEEAEKFIKICDDAAENNKIPKFKSSVESKIKSTPSLDLLTDGLSISIAEFNSQSTQLNIFEGGILPIKFEFLMHNNNLSMRLYTQ